MQGDFWRNINLNWLVSMVPVEPDSVVTVDDIQGTGCVTQAAIKAAAWVTKEKMTDQKIVIFGSGTAGTGTAIHGSGLI